MGNKLKATCADLERLSSALKQESARPLEEARKRKKYRRPKSESRKERQKREKEARLHAPEVTRRIGIPDDEALANPLIQQGRDRVAARGPALKKDDPTGAPKTGTKLAGSRAARRAASAPAPAAAVVKVKRQAVKLPIATPIKPTPVKTATVKVIADPARLGKAHPAPPKGSSKPTPVPAKTAMTPAKKSLWDRVRNRLSHFLSSRKAAPTTSAQDKDKDKTKPTGFDRLRNAMQHIAQFFGARKKLMDDVYVPRTLVALHLTEERNKSTFKKCKDGAMVSSPYLRDKLPKNIFVKPGEEPTEDEIKDYMDETGVSREKAIKTLTTPPTYPVRTNCRASLAALGRSIQTDMGNPGEYVVGEVIRRANKTTGLTRGRLNLRLWGTGRGGRRMETFRGPPGKAKRTKTLAKRLGIPPKEAAKLHGVSTGRADNQKHTPPYSPPGGSKGPAYNRPAPKAAERIRRHAKKHGMSYDEAKTALFGRGPRKETNKKTKRRRRRESHKRGRGQARVGE